ncbi:HD-GYP domain-containing protein [Deinococcus sonorensis]|uniref:HD domain-containing phosphohydrolase n=2 Tax=Deinococcus sonorensis TaxID=309891 RepID=A0AAU7UEI1_9DEIO
MFKRKAPAAVPPSAASASTPSEPDSVRLLTELLARPTQEGVLDAALAQAGPLLGAQVRGLGILRRGQDKVAAVLDYPRSLLGVELSGPWVSGRVRALTDGARELYAANGPEVTAQLDAAGMRAVGLSLVVPLADRGRGLGALLLDWTTGGTVTPAQQETMTRFGAAVGGLLGLIEGREEWRQAARQLTVAVVEAVESREFDALGHARQVAELAVQLGRGLGLSGRELDEVWYAATLHDLGKIHGENGHAQVGANFIEGVATLGEVQRAVRHHHERWDGQGEPDHLTGEDIPLYARLVAVANTYVRVGSVERVKAQAGKALDPRLVAALEKLNPDQR